MSELTQKYLKEILEYNPNTGIFRWKVSRGGTKKGTVAGNKTNGYIAIQINYIAYKAHRLAFLYMNGKFPIDEVDHKNRIRDDNTWDNIIDSTHWENQQNKDTSSKSGIVGVTWEERSQRWISKITVSGKRIFLGQFKDLEDAHIARIEAEMKYDIA